MNCGLPLNYISYAAFYGDAMHKITPVETGTRITLSYHQLLRDEEPLVSSSSDAVDASQVVQSVYFTKRV